MLYFIALLLPHGFGKYEKCKKKLKQKNMIKDALKPQQSQKQINKLTTATRTAGENCQTIDRKQTNKQIK